MLISLVLGLIIGALVIIFALQNITTVTVAFLGWHIEGSLALVLVLTFVSGMLLSLLLTIPNAIKRRITISHLKNQNNQLSKTVETKSAEIKDEKAKLAVTNSYLDSIEKK